MKPLFFLFIVLLAACSEPKSKLQLAQESVRTHLKESMHNWQSYQPVKWGTLDSTYTDPEKLPEYKKALEVAKEANKETKYNLEMADVYKGSYYLQAKYSYYLDRAKKYNTEAGMAFMTMKSIIDTFQPKFNGYVIQHSYRGKNGQGNQIIEHEKFYLDSMLKVVDVVDNSKKENDDEN